MEHSLITPLAQLRSLPEDPQRPLLTYGEVIELRFVECGMMLSVDLDYEGLAYASWGRQHHRTQHDIRFHAPGRPKGGAGLPVCYGDELVLKCRGWKDQWYAHPLLAGLLLLLHTLSPPAHPHTLTPPLFPSAGTGSA